MSLTIALALIHSRNSKSHQLLLNWVVLLDWCIGHTLKDFTIAAQTHTDSEAWHKTFIAMTIINGHRFRLIISNGWFIHFSHVVDFSCCVLVYHLQSDKNLKTIKWKKKLQRKHSQKLLIISFSFYDGCTIIDKSFACILCLLRYKKKISWK